MSAITAPKRMFLNRDLLVRTIDLVRDVGMGTREVGKIALQAGESREQLASLVEPLSKERREAVQEGLGMPTSLSEVRNTAIELLYKEPVFSTCNLAIWLCYDNPPYDDNRARRIQWYENLALHFATHALEFDDFAMLCHCLQHARERQQLSHPLYREIEDLVFALRQWTPEYVCALWSKPSFLSDVERTALCPSLFPNV